MDLHFTAARLEKKLGRKKIKRRSPSNVINFFFFFFPKIVQVTLMETQTLEWIIES